AHQGGCAYMSGTAATGTAVGAGAIRATASASKVARAARGATVARAAMRSLPGMRAAGTASNVLGDVSAFEGSGILARYGKAFSIAGKAETVAAVALAGIDVAMAWKREHGFDHVVRQKAASDAGGVWGGIEGASMGAAWGTALLPGIGTVAGGI